MAKKNKCILTGKEFNVRPDVEAVRITKYGSKERLMALYICQEAGTLLKAGKSVQEVRAELGVTIDTEVPQEAVDIILANAGKKTAVKKAMSMVQNSEVSSQEIMNGEGGVVEEVPAEETPVIEFQQEVPPTEEEVPVAEEVKTKKKSGKKSKK